MAANKLEIKIKEDSLHNDVTLSSMPVDAAKDFLSIVAIFIEIAENSIDKEGVAVNIFEGSSGIALMPKQSNSNIIPQMYEQFDEVCQRKIEDSKIVSPWAQLQKIAKQSSYVYEGGFFFSEGEPIPVMRVLKESPDIRKKRSKSPHNVTICFFHTELNTAGGENKDKSSIKIHDENGKQISIKCRHEDILIARGYVQEEVSLSAWKEFDSQGKAIYTLCDVYHPNSNQYQEFKEISDKIFNANTELEGLSILHDTLRGYLDVQNFDDLVEFTRLFMHKSISVDILKTILIVTKSFKNHTSYKVYRKIILDLLEKPKQRKTDTIG